MPTSRDGGHKRHTTRDQVVRPLCTLSLSFRAYVLAGQSLADHTRYTKILIIRCTLGYRESIILIILALRQRAAHKLLIADINVWLWYDMTLQDSPFLRPCPTCSCYAPPPLALQWRYVIGRGFPVISLFPRGLDSLHNQVFNSTYLYHTLLVLLLKL